MTDPTNSRYRHLHFKSEQTYRRFIQADKSEAIQPSTIVHQENDIPAHGTYGSLLFHPKWKEKREEILKRDEYCCVVCQDKNVLQVHHRQYQFVVRENQFRLPWDYPGHLLITLCESCHKRGHSKFKVPTVNV